MREQAERLQTSAEAELQALKARGGLEGNVATSILNERERGLRRSARISAWATGVTAGATV